MKRHEAPSRDSLAQGDKSISEHVQDSSQQSVDAVRSARGDSLLLSEAEESSRPSESVGRRSIQEHLGIRQGVMSVEVCADLVTLVCVL
jgi:hypothetical protein